MQKFISIILAIIIWAALNSFNAFSQDKLIISDKSVVHSSEEKDDITNAAEIYHACNGYFESHFNNSEILARRSTCVGYFYGIGSTLLMLQFEGTNTDMCLPQGLTTEDIIKNFLTWAEQNRNELKNLLAIKAVFKSLKTSYPCQTD